MDKREGGIDWEKDKLEELTIYNTECKYSEVGEGDYFIRNEIIFEKTEGGFEYRTTTQNYSPPRMRTKQLFWRMEILYPKY